MKSSIDGLMNMSHLQGGMGAVGVNMAAQFLAKQINARYGQIIGAAATFVIPSILAEMMIKDKALRESIVIGSKTLALKDVVVAVFTELYGATIGQLSATVDATKQVDLLKKKATYEKVLSLAGAYPVVMVNGNPAIPQSIPQTGTDNGLAAGGEGSMNPVMDLRADSGVNRY